MMLNVKLSLLSKTEVEYLPLSTVISTSKYDSAVAHSVVFFSRSSGGYMSSIAASNWLLFSISKSLYY